MRFGAKDSDEEDHFRSVYRSYIKPALEEAGYDCTRADEMSRPGVIFDNVLDMLFQADICVTDITRLSANVFYELAIRQLARPTGTILICDRSQEPNFVIPVDIAPLRVHSYEFTATKAPALRSIVQDAIREIREIEEDEQIVMKDGIAYKCTMCDYRKDRQFEKRFDPNPFYDDGKSSRTQGIAVEP